MKLHESSERDYRRSIRHFVLRQPSPAPGRNASQVQGSRRKCARGCTSGGFPMLFRQLFDPETSTYSYLLADEVTRDAILIDPVLDQIERDIDLLRDLDLQLRYALDTHVHADHITALGSLRERLGANTVISERAGVGCA